MSESATAYCERRAQEIRQMDAAAQLTYALDRGAPDPPLANEYAQAVEQGEAACQRLRRQDIRFNNQWSSLIYRICRKP